MLTLYRTLTSWFVSADAAPAHVTENSDGIDWLRVIPFILIHVGCFAVLWVGFSWAAFWTALCLYWLRGISISAFYHRYFSHRAYKTSRAAQFIFAVLGASAMQKGPLWWASWHRNHHRFSDQVEDVHSPIAHGFLWSHMGWFLTKKNFYYDSSKVTDLSKYSELRLLDRYYFFVPFSLAVLLYIIGSGLHDFNPSLNTSGGQMLVWGFFISTMAVFHTTAAVNSLAHQFGKRPYQTKDNSRNSLLLALLTFGEGWHNNHHYYAASARLGFKWHEIDVTYYLLKSLEKVGIIWDLRGSRKEAQEFKALNSTGYQES